MTTENKDLWLKLLGSLIVSVLVGWRGADETLQKIGSDPFAYLDLLANFLIIFALWEAISRITRWLDKKYDWRRDTLIRMLTQINVGIFLPLFLSCFFVLVYVRLVWSQNILETDFLHSDIYYLLLFILLVNLIYVVWWFRLNPSRTLQAASHALASGVNPEFSRNERETDLMISSKEISLITESQENSIVLTRLGEQVRSSLSIDDFIARLDPKEFFQIDSKTLVARQSCQSFHSVENGDILLVLSDDTPSPLTISGRKVQEFRDWILM